MARMLIIGGGRRGEELARRLTDEGHAVRIVTRDEGRREAIEAAGAQLHLGDPDRIGTIEYAFDHVTIVCWLLGTARGEPEAIAALHGPRLERVLEEIIDTTVRGFVYEAAGTVPADVLTGGAARVRRAHETSMIPVAVLDVDPADREAWVAGAERAIHGLLSG
jgi:uncharacterized protein YbjT (DUF2867 family)